MCFVGGIDEVETSADGPNRGRLKNYLGTEAIEHCGQRGLI